MELAILPSYRLRCNVQGIRLLCRNGRRDQQRQRDQGGRYGGRTVVHVRIKGLRRGNDPVKPAGYRERLAVGLGRAIIIPLGGCRAGGDGGGGDLPCEQIVVAVNNGISISRSRRKLNHDPRVARNARVQNIPLIKIPFVPGEPEFGGRIAIAVKMFVNGNLF